MFSGLAGDLISLAWAGGGGVLQGYSPHGEGLLERRRQALALSIQEARQDLAQGAVRRGSADELLGEF